MAYNRSKGIEPNEISEILEPLHACLRELLESDRRGKTHLIEYTDKDVIAASLVYSHILGNRLVHHLTKEKASLERTKLLGNSYGEAIQKLTKGMSGVDLNDYYKGKGKGE
jgi:hypothetical protein